MGSVGLITYMRTDSVNLSTEAVTEIREMILEWYGKENLPASPRTYKTKAKNASAAAAKLYEWVRTKPGLFKTSLLLNIIFLSTPWF